MPLKATDYSKTVIYRISHKELAGLDYVGSTTDFTQRKWDHKHNCLNPDSKSHQLKVYKTIREHGGWDMFRMLEIKKFPCTDKREAQAEEERCRVELNAQLNMKRAYISVEDLVKYYAEHYQANQEACLKRDAEYRQSNKAKINEKFDCECGGKFTHKNKSGHLKSQKHQAFLLK